MKFLKIITILEFKIIFINKKILNFKIILLYNKYKNKLFFIGN